MRVPLCVVLLLAAGSLSASGGGELKQSAVLGRGSPLLAVQGVAPLPDGGLLVADKLDYRVKWLTSAGVQVAMVGGRGRGPGRFQGPGPIDVHGERIAVADHATNRIQFFNRALTPLSTVTVDGAVSDLCFDGAGNLWVAAVTMRKERGIIQLDPSGRERRVLPLHNGSGDIFYDAGFIAWLGGGRIAFAYYLLNKIEIWDTSGRFIREFSIAGLPSRAPGKMIGGADGRGSMIAPEGKIFRSMTSDGRGRIYLLISDYGRAPGMELVAADGEGNELGRYLLPTRAVQIRSDREGGFYIVPPERDAVIRLSMSGGN
jgi:hypothetical protein